ncbi:cell wall-binding repeat-containing protein [Paenibacillus apii]|uniref:cell wall-binding repeat-containing protein n=1 Tax=Paenibacillus apii TaxID=1850370 RepID=UPI00143C67EB|nr:cell wall-binding repeat-containing protein [Paenibacillus apii]NJJ40866.1 cell wall-binding repeat-containing protein [Paenibacillus apii]
MKKGIAVVSITLVLSAVLAGCQIGNKAPEPAAQDTGTASVAVPWVGTKNTTRINTSDPVEAAVLVSRTLWTAVSDSNRPASVVLTDVSNWQIAAVSTDLIHHPSNGPVLFFEKDKVPEATLAEIKRLKPVGAETNDNIQIVIVGPVSAGVEEQLKALNMKTDKIEGDEPAAVAQAIDAYYAKVAGELPQAVVVGSMDSPEYTLPAVNWIAHMPEPLLYVKKDEIPAPTVEALKNRGGNAAIYLIGPESAVSTDVENELKSYGTVTRISGNDPYANSIAFAQFKDQGTKFGWGITTPGHNLSFLTQDDPTLAIAAAPFSHLGKHAPLIFTNKDGMPDSVMEYAMTLQPKFQDSPAEGPYNHAWITGDSSAISNTAQSEIDDMLEISPASGGNPHTGH